MLMLYESYVFFDYLAVLKLSAPLYKYQNKPYFRYQKGRTGFSPYVLPRHFN